MKKLLEEGAKVVFINDSVVININVVAVELQFPGGTVLEVRGCQIACEPRGTDANFLRVLRRGDLLQELVRHQLVLSIKLIFSLLGFFFFFKNKINFIKP